MPNSSLVSTMPTPKSSSHSRLTATRAVSGFSALTSHFAVELRIRSVVLLVQLGELRADLRELLLAADRGDGQLRRIVAAVGVLRVIEDRVKLVELALRNRVVLVVVALATGDRRAHPD